MFPESAVILVFPVFPWSAVFQFQVFPESGVILVFAVLPVSSVF